LVLFKREFNYPQILRLWEVFWTDGPFHGDEDSYSATYFHLLVALSILDSQRNTILENRFGFTEILKVHTHTIQMIQISYLVYNVLLFSTACE
jgi:hypothetical protein